MEESPPIHKIPLETRSNILGNIKVNTFITKDKSVTQREIRKVVFQIIL